MLFIDSWSERPEWNTLRAAMLFSSPHWYWQAMPVETKQLLFSQLPLLSAASGDCIVSCDRVSQRSRATVSLYSRQPCRPRTSAESLCLKLAFVEPAREEWNYFKFQGGDLVLTRSNNFLRKSFVFNRKVARRWEKNQNTRHQFNFVTFLITLPFVLSSLFSAIKWMQSCYVRKSQCHQGLQTNWKFSNGFMH